MGTIGYYGDLKNFFWLTDSKHFVFTSLIGSSSGTYIVDTNTKEVVRIDPYKSLTEANSLFKYDPISNRIFITKDYLTRPP